MAIAQMKAQQTLGPEPGSEAIDQRIERGAGRRCAVEIGLAGGKRLCDRHGKTHGIETEARIERVFETREAVREQRDDRRGMAHWRAGLDEDLLLLAVAAEKHGLEAAPALSARLQNPARLGEQVGEHAKHIIGAGDRLREAAFDLDGRKHAARCDGAFRLARHTAHRRCRFRPEARGKTGKRPAGKVADSIEPGAA